MRRTSRPVRLRCWLWGATFLVATGCKTTSEERGSQVGLTTVAETHVLDAELEPAMPRADLAEIRLAGVLRVLVAKQLEADLYDNDYTATTEKQLNRLADKIGVKIRYVVVSNGEGILDALMEGRGDLAVDVPAKSHPTAVLFSPPWRTVDLVLARGVEDRSKENGAAVCISAPLNSYGFSSTAGIPQPVTILRHVDELDVFEEIAQGTCKSAVTFAQEWEMYRKYADDVKIERVVQQAIPLVWAVRSNCPKLLQALSGEQFLNELTVHQGETESRDLAEIKKRRVLRVAMLNNAASYFIYRGQEVGFQYEMAQLLAQRLQVRLQVIVPDKPGDLLDLVRSGRVDLAPVALDEQQEAIAGVDLSEPFLFADHVLVQPANEAPLKTLADLQGKEIVVRRSSSYFKTLSELSSQVNDVRVVPADEELETEELIAQVGRGEIHLTVANSVLLDVEKNFNKAIQGSLRLRTRQPLVYAMAGDAPRLKERVNRFIQTDGHGEFFRLLTDKYFQNKERIEEMQSQTLEKSGRISPFDELVQKYAKQYGLDWRLVLAQMYQESKFNPDARSWAGARGLMQLMPRTARELGFHEFTAPENNIHAGIKYMNYLMERIGDGLETRQRVRMALAAYNAGLGHVRDAQKLARARGLDDKRWFDNVEKTIVLLEKRAYYRRARHGYCRGSEPVAYVSRIQTKYEAYARMVPDVDELDLR